MESSFVVIARQAVGLAWQSILILKSLDSFVKSIESAESFYILVLYVICIYYGLLRAYALAMTKRENCHYEKWHFCVESPHCHCEILRSRIVAIHFLQILWNRWNL